MKAKLVPRFTVLLTLPVLVLLSTASRAQFVSGSPQKAWGRVSPALQSADDMGPVDRAQPINLTLRLTSGKDQAFHQAVDALYDPSSSSFHQWMSDKTLAAYAPSAQQMKIVQTELESHGLTIVSVDPNNLSLRVSGTATTVEAAFHTQLHQFRSGTRSFRSNLTAAHLNGEADQYLSSVAGLESHTIRPMLARALDSRTGQPHQPIPLTAVSTTAPGLGGMMTDQSLSAPVPYNFKTTGAVLPIAIYFGNRYAANSNLVPGFMPAQLQAAYGLPAAYKLGLTGAGQTIVLLEAYGDSHIEADANAFCALTGLPPLTASTFSVVYPEGPIANADQLAAESAWDIEIALDVEWAHAIAPGAKIIVAAASGQDSETFENAIGYITSNQLGYAVSDSWEEDLDLIASPLEQQAFEDALEVAAAKGISFQFSTGDHGDYGLGTPVGTAGVPSDAPHATAVGGTSLLNNLTGGGFFPVGWGNVLSYLDSDGILVPSTDSSFLGGGGGGESTYFAKPAWQKSLPGTGRQTPDISALADPFTGVPIVVTTLGTQTIILGYGGTSLASPIVTAFWALAEQKAGAPLGQAAPLIATLSSAAIQDVLPVASPTNVAGAIFGSTGPAFYSASAPFEGHLYDTTKFVSAMWNQSTTEAGLQYADFGFGIDTSLSVEPGWDNVTGYGTPIGLPFIEAVAAAALRK